MKEDKKLQKISKILKNNNITPSELEKIIKGLNKTRKPSKTYKHYLSGNSFKIGLISDTHIGSEKFIEELFFHAGDVFRKEKVRAVYHAGDIVEGLHPSRGHIYELTHIGFENQVNYAAELFSKAMRGLIVYGITGNHDEWYEKFSNSGANVGRALENRTDNFKYLGQSEADIVLGRNLKMKLFHPNDGSAYATSYKLEKLIESLSGGKKPDILVEGHYHKALYMFRRNIHAFEAGTFCDQTRYMRGKKMPAHLGFWVVEIEQSNKRGIGRISPTFYPAYD